MTDNTQELKPCPFCGASVVANESGLVRCYNHPCGTVSVERWNTRAQPSPAAGVVDSALRYLFQVGYTVAHADCTMEKPYDGDAGKNYDIYRTREPEASVLRALAALPAPSVGEDAGVAIIQEHLDNLIGGGVCWETEARDIYSDLLAAGVIRGK